MKNLALENLSVTELVNHFTTLALEQYQAELRDDIASYNRLYDKIVLIRDALKERPGDQRRALVPLLGHPNPQVRLKAALYTLAVEPKAARQILQDISDRNEYPQAAYARETLAAIERGDSRLT